MNLISSIGFWIGIGAAVVGGIIIIALIAFIIGTYNSLIRMRNSCEEAWATIDVFLKKRYDLIPNLIETVKGYAKHEEGTLAKVIEARNKAMNAQGADAKIDAENQLNGCLKTLFSLTESYPNLKADSQFLDLQRQLQLMENDLAQSRKYYNGVSKGFNIKIESFPSNLIASAMKLNRRNYFELDSAQERNNVKVSF